MAYLRELHTPKCCVPYCGKKATHQLIDRWNGERGTYCRKHGKPAAEAQAKNESANDGRVHDV